MATIRISEGTYKRLNEAAGELRVRLKRPVSMDEVLEFLMKERKLRPADFDGSWSMSDEEARNIRKGLKVFWSRWRFHAK